MAQRTQLIFTDNPGALPASYSVPPSLDLVIQSIVARFNGAAAAGAFLPCLAVYSQDGHLMGRFHPNTELAVGDTAVVTYAPFLRASTAAAAASGADLAGLTEIPLWAMGLPSSASLGYSWTFDTTYPGGGYLGALANTRVWSVLVPLGPYGSIWGLRYGYATGPDFGKFDIAFAKPGEPNPNRSTGITDGTLQDYDTGLTYFNIVTGEDAYTAVLDKTFRHNGTIPFQVAGVDGTAFTGFSGIDPLTGYSLLQGGSGIYRLRFRTNGQNAASTGFIQRFTRVALFRLDDGGYP